MLQSIFYLNEQGHRENIEDSIYPLPGNAILTDILFMVCDGVGGESKGEEASRIICEAIPEYFNNNKDSVIDAAFLQRAAAFAVEKLKDYAATHPVAARMSSTLTLCCLQKNNIAIAWCGDSRVYHIRHGKVLWKSTDHSLVMELVKHGEITEEEAINHPRKNMIMRSLSAAEGNDTIDTYFINDYEVGDYLLLCTDGVLENIDENAIYEILREKQQGKNKRDLFLNYCRNKTSDNFSLYLLQLSEKAKSAKNTVNEKSKVNYLWAIIIGISIIAAVFFIFQNRANKQNPTNHSATPKTIPSNQPPLPVGQNKKDTTSKSADSTLLKILNKHIKNN